MKVEHGRNNAAVTIADTAETKAALKAVKNAATAERQEGNSAHDTVDISPQAAKLSAAEIREQAALARIGLLNQQNEAVVQSDSGEGESKGTSEEDPLTKFINTVFKMLEERQVIQQKNAEEQVEKQREAEAVQAERKAEGEEALAGEEAALPDGQQGGAETRINAPDEPRPSGKPGRVTASYGKKGAYVMPGNTDGSTKGNYKAQA